MINVIIPLNFCMLLYNQKNEISIVNMKSKDLDVTHILSLRLCSIVT